MTLRHAKIPTRRGGVWAPGVSFKFSVHGFGEEKTGTWGTPGAQDAALSVGMIASAWGYGLRRERRRLMVEAG
jgi:hypothetical protein